METRYARIVRESDEYIAKAKLANTWWYQLHPYQWREFGDDPNRPVETAVFRSLANQTLFLRKLKNA